ADRNRSHWSTSKTPSYTKSVSWQHHPEAHEKMTFVYTRRESYVMPMNITEFFSKLPPSHFFRCHRSFCVNLNKIREIEPWFNNTYILRLKDLDFEVPVSRSKVKEFRQLMHL
ncbi:LytTR family DNA-binding domain-containing protein, partial [Escherichia coli]|uniref:LytTR family DNA-binding domain-containing protein n=1 Tax=Escherichia coli TaxID=562 RepID=UPI001EDD6D4C